MASPNSEQQSGPPDSESYAAPRAALVTAALVVVAIATAVGVLFYRSGKDVVAANVSPAASTRIRGPADAPIAPPGAPQPHTEGQDCSHDHIAMRWQRRDSRWVCAAPGLVSNDHREGDDCSHGDIDARWEIGPGPAWVCVPQNQSVEAASQAEGPAATSVQAPTPPSATPQGPASPGPRPAPLGSDGPAPAAPELSPAPEAVPAPEPSPAPQAVPAPESPPAPQAVPAPQAPPAPEPRPAPEPPPPPPFGLPPIQLPGLPFPPPPR